MIVKNKSLCMYNDKIKVRTIFSFSNQGNLKEYNSNSKTYTMYKDATLTIDREGVEINFGSDYSVIHIGNCNSLPIRLAERIISIKYGGKDLGIIKILVFTDRHKIVKYEKRYIFHSVKADKKEILSYLGSGKYDIFIEYTDGKIASVYKEEVLLRQRRPSI